MRYTMQAVTCTYAIIVFVYNNSVDYVTVCGFPLITGSGRYVG